MLAMGAKLVFGIITRTTMQGRAQIQRNHLQVVPRKFSVIADRFKTSTAAVWFLHDPRTASLSYQYT